VSIAAKITLGAVLGVLVVSACIKLAATRGRRATLTEIRYTAPFRWQVSAPIADHPSTSLDTINLQFGTGGRCWTES